MDLDFQHAVGKTAGEIARDFSDFLALSFEIDGVDLRDLSPEFNMEEQFSFALLKEAQVQGWPQKAMENFFLRVCEKSIDPATKLRFLNAFKVPDGKEYAELESKYRSDFSLSDKTYWASCLTIGIEAKQARPVLEYLQRFTVCLMEFAYMDGKQPESTYVWGYYESFKKILEEFNRDDKPAEPLIVRAVGAGVGICENDVYTVTLGVDIENPNPEKIACGISLDIFLKDKDGNVVQKISDSFNCIDPASVFHYGITKQIKGDPVFQISAEATAEIFSAIRVPAMKGIKLSGISLKRGENAQTLFGTLTSHYPSTLNGFTIYYQYLDKEGRIVGGGSEWIFDSIAPEESVPLKSGIGLILKDAAKVLYSIDFNLKDLLNAES